MPRTERRLLKEDDRASEEAIAMERHLVVMIPVFLTLASSTASAQTVRLDQYQHPSTPQFKVFNSLYLAGVRDGLIAYSVRQGPKDRLFCLPPTMVLTTEQTEEIMLRFAEKRRLPGNTWIGVPLLGGRAIPPPPPC
jgi:hypothetical protein